jgi:hypothetical protein
MGHSWQFPSRIPFKNGYRKAFNRVNCGRTANSALDTRFPKRGDSEKVSGHIEYHQRSVQAFAETHMTLSSDP